MKIHKLLIRNYKKFTNIEIEFKENCNIFVGNNDSGKSSLLEAIQIVLSGKLNGFSFERQLTANFFNKTIRDKYIKQIESKEEAKLPEIIIEAYFFDIDGLAAYKGTNNELSEDLPGIRFEVVFNDIYSEIYKAMVNENQIYDIPVEFYSVNWRPFSDNMQIVSRFLPIRLSIIDTTHKDYSPALTRFINSSVTDNLSDVEKINLAQTYRKMKNNFNTHEVVQELNKKIKKEMQLNEQSISFELKEETINEWQNLVTVNIEEIPFEQMGFGTQNMIKMELAYKEETNKSSIVLFEEPENNLSFSNMSRLISKIERDESKQVFISTHSSFVANKLGLQKIYLLYDGKCKTLSQINSDTIDYFMKLPGYNTVRFLLSNKVILVEGPTEELIIQRAYLDKYGILPIEEGTDIIAVDSLAFKRYCDLAITVNKKLNIVTDNDGDIFKNIKQKYKDYINEHKDIIKIYYEEDEKLNTLEKSVLNVNTQNKEFELFKKSISKKGSLISKDCDEIEEFMLTHKT